MDSKIFNLSIPKSLVEIINNQARLNYSTRNEYIKQAILTRLKSEGALDAVNQPTPQASLQEMKNAQLKEFLSEYEIDTSVDLDSNG